MRRDDGQWFVGGQIVAASLPGVQYEVGHYALRLESFTAIRLQPGGAGGGGQQPA